MRIAASGTPAVVTGGARGIGAAVVAKLHELGHPVASLDVLPQPARDGVLAIDCDLESPAAIVAAVSSARTSLGPASVLVHCAAYQPLSPFGELTSETWDRTFRVNVESVLHLLQTMASDVRREGGRVVIITSSSYFQPPAGMVHYVASKGALTGIVRALSIEWGGDGVTVNAVAPGLTATESALAHVPAEHFAQVQRRQAIPRTGLPKDVAAAVAFLVSAEASFITGQTLLVDGGESRL